MRPRSSHLQHIPQWNCSGCSQENLTVPVGGFQENVQTGHLQLFCHPCYEALSNERRSKPEDTKLIQVHSKTSSSKDVNEEFQKAVKIISERRTIGSEVYKQSSNSPCISTEKNVEIPGKVIPGSTLARIVSVSVSRENLYPSSCDSTRSYYSACSNSVGSSKSNRSLNYLFLETPKNNDINLLNVKSTNSSVNDPDFYNMLCSNEPQSVNSDNYKLLSPNSLDDTLILTSAVQTPTNSSSTENNTVTVTLYRNTNIKSNKCSKNDPTKEIDTHLSNSEQTIPTQKNTALNLIGGAGAGAGGTSSSSCSQELLLHDLPTSLKNSSYDNLLTSLKPITPSRANWSTAYE